MEEEGAKDEAQLVTKSAASPWLQTWGRIARL